MAITFDRGGRPDHPPGSGMLSPVSQDSRPTGLTYEPFYGLKEKPFSLTSDARFFYQSRSHAPAFDDLLNAIRRRESLNVLTGDIGTGKTTLCRAVLQSLDRKTFSAFVQDPFASREELLKVLLTDFGVASIDDVASGRLRDATRTELSYLLYEFLATLAPLQAFAVVFIDEAQNLSRQLLEEVRILSDADGQLQVVLVGQLELRDRLKQPDMRQLDQRVSVHCQLQPLDLAGVAGYISHRLHKAGGSADRVSFSGEAVEAIYLLSGGVPRLINRFCDRALRQGYAKRAAMIDAEMVRDAEVRPAPVAPAQMPPAEIESSPAAGVRPAVATPEADPIVASSEPQADVRPVEAASPPAPPPVEVAPAAPTPVDVAAAAPPQIEAAPEQKPAQLTPMPAPPPRMRLQPQDVESWLRHIEEQPQDPAAETETDWRQRWAPTNAVAAAPPDRRSGVTLRVPSSHGATRVDPVRRRGTRRLAAAALILFILLGAIVAGPSTVSASLELLSNIDDRFTPPPPPDLPPQPHFRMPAPLRLPASEDPLSIDSR